MKVLSFHRVHEWDGGERSLPTKFAFVDPKDVKEYREKNPHNSVYREEIYIFESYKDFENFKNGEIRRKALDKLTAEERAALGLPVEL